MLEKKFHSFYHSLMAICLLIPKTGFELEATKFGTNNASPSYELTTVQFPISPVCVQARNELVDEVINGTPLTCDKQYVLVIIKTVGVGENRK